MTYWLVRSLRTSPQYARRSDNNQNCYISYGEVNILAKPLENDLFLQYLNRPYQNSCQIVTHFFLEGGKVSLHSLVFPLQGLHAGQITSVIVGGEHGVFLHDPRDRLVGVAVEVLDLVSSEKPLLALECQLAKPLPRLVQFLNTTENRYDNTIDMTIQWKTDVKIGFSLNDGVLNTMENIHENKISLNNVVVITSGLPLSYSKVGIGTFKIFTI